jgi:Large polyvalent protein-associated domain 7
MNTISEGKSQPQSLYPNTQSPTLQTPATLDLVSEITDAKIMRGNGDNEGSRARSNISSRSDLRAAAVNEIARDQPTISAIALPIEREVVRRWVDLDIVEFSRMRSDTKRANAIDSIASNARVSPEYTDELTKRSPIVAEVAIALNQDRDRQETQQLKANLENQRQAKVAARAVERQELIDGAALAAVSKVRQEQSAAVVARMSKIAEPTDKDIQDTKRAINNPSLDGKAMSQYDPDIVAQSTRTIKRPILEDELTLALRGRYIVSHEKTGMFSVGSTDFTFRNGQMQGQVAFVDAGKSISSTLTDKGTIRSMIELATIKNWKEISVTGTEDFRRNAWIEAKMLGLDVNGYEPRAADKKLLAELLSENKPSNQIRQIDSTLPQDQRRAENNSQRTSAPSSQRVHIDADRFTPKEEKVLNVSRDYMRSQQFSDQWTDATIDALAKKLRAERVYIGELISHGKAPYENNEKNAESYFVTLKTSRGEKVIWGKELPAAMENRTLGEIIVLQNTGKVGVVVKEQEFDKDGKVIGLRAKDAVRNEWTADLLANFTTPQRDEVLRKSQAKEPVIPPGALKESSIPMASQSKSHSATSVPFVSKSTEREVPSPQNNKEIDR